MERGEVAGVGRRSGASKAKARPGTPADRSWQLSVCGGRGAAGQWAGGAARPSAQLARTSARLRFEELSGSQHGGSNCGVRPSRRGKERDRSHVPGPWFSGKSGAQPSKRRLSTSVTAPATRSDATVSASNAVARATKSASERGNWNSSGSRPRRCLLAPVSRKRDGECVWWPHGS